MNTLKSLLTLTAFAITSFAPAMEQMQSTIPPLKILAARQVHSYRKLSINTPQDIINLVNNSPDEMISTLKSFMAKRKNLEIASMREYMLKGFVPLSTIEKQHPFVTADQIQFNNWDTDGYEALVMTLIAKREDLAKLCKAGMPAETLYKSLYKLFERHYEDKYTLIQTFLNFNLVSLKNKYDNWPVVCSALKMKHNNNCTALINSLIACGCDANAREDLNGETALMLACQKGCAPCARELIQAGAKIEATDDNGKTAVVHATIEDSVDAFRVLVEHNANINMQYKDKNLFDYAKEQRRVKILRAMRIAKEEKQ